MVKNFWIAITTVWLPLFGSTVWAATPIPHVQVTFRGTKYDITDVTTVEELQTRVSDASGVDPTKQGRVIFNGQRLGGNDSLSDVGVSDGSQLNIVPSKSGSTSAAAAKSKSALKDTSISPNTATPNMNDPNAFMQDLMAKAGIDSDQLDELVKGMGGGAGADGKPPTMQESVEMMSNMMNSPLIQQYMSDPEQLEKSRQMILENPMLRQMMGSMPGMEELINDKEAWREAMQAAASLYKNMDSEQLMQAMMGGASAGGFDMNANMNMNGLFDTNALGGTSSSATGSSSSSSTSASSSNLSDPSTLALDELSDGDD